MNFVHDLATLEIPAFESARVLLALRSPTLIDISNILGNNILILKELMFRYIVMV